MLQDGDLIRWAAPNVEWARSETGPHGGRNRVTRQLLAYQPCG